MIALAWDLLSSLGVEGWSWRSIAWVPQTTAIVFEANWWIGCEERADQLDPDSQGPNHKSLRILEKHKHQALLAEAPPCWRRIR